MCVHGYECLDTHMEVRGTGLWSQVSSSFPGALGLNSPVTRRAGQVLPAQPSHQPTAHFFVEDLAPENSGVERGLVPKLSP